MVEAGMDRIGEWTREPRSEGVSSLGSDGWALR